MLRYPMHKGVIGVERRGKVNILGLCQPGKGCGLWLCMKR